MDTKRVLERRNAKVQQKTNRIDVFRGYVKKAIEGFINDPPDSEYQRGFLASLLCLYREALEMPLNDKILIAGENILLESTRKGV